MKIKIILFIILSAILIGVLSPFIDSILDQFWMVPIMKLIDYVNLRKIIIITINKYKIFIWFKNLIYKCIFNIIYNKLLVYLGYINLIN